MLKLFKRYKVVQDLHSYFYQTLAAPRGISDRLYGWLIRYCLREADLTIVTNDFLAWAISAYAAQAFVLQDRIPDICAPGTTRLAGDCNVVFICAYSDDEPIAEVLQAARQVSNEIHVYITGRVPREAANWIIPRNVHLTGYLSEQDYARLLNSADAVLALTTRDHTLLCAAYEGVALGKPLIMSEKQALKDYFTKGVVFTKNDSHSLTAALYDVRRRLETLRCEIKELKEDIARPWQVRFCRLRTELERLTRVTHG